MASTPYVVSNADFQQWRYIRCDSAARRSHSRRSGTPDVRRGRRFWAGSDIWCDGAARLSPIVSSLPRQEKPRGIGAEAYQAPRREPEHTAPSRINRQRDEITILGVQKVWTQDAHISSQFREQRVREFTLLVSSRIVYGNNSYFEKSVGHSRSGWRLVVSAVRTCADSHFHS